VNVTSAYTGTVPYSGITATNPPPTKLYYGVDGANWSWQIPTSAGGANPASYSIALPPQQVGLHLVAQPEPSEVGAHVVGEGLVRVAGALLPEGSDCCKRDKTPPRAPRRRSVVLRSIGSS